MKLELSRQREEWPETRLENNLKQEGPSLGHHGDTALSEGHDGAQPGGKALELARLAHIPLPATPK